MKKSQLLEKIISEINALQEKAREESKLADDHISINTLAGKREAYLEVYTMIFEQYRSIPIGE